MKKSFLKKNWAEALFICLLFLLLSLASHASDAETSPTEEASANEDDRQTLMSPWVEDKSELSVHGFISQGFIQSTRNNFIPTSTNGSTEFAEAGLTMNKQLGSNLRAGLQLFARDFGRTGGYEAKFDWFLLDYRWRDWLGFRAGRIKLPFGLYNDSSDIDSARNSVLLPQSVYPINNRDYLLAQTGFEIYGITSLPSAGSLEYRLYRGTIQLEANSAPGAAFEVASIDVPYVHGGRLTWETPLSGLRIGSSYQNLQLNSDVYVPSLTKTVTAKLHVDMAVGSIEYTTRNFQFASEYSKWWLNLDSNDTAAFPSTAVTNERYYAMASFRAKEWLHPGLSYSVTYPNVELRDSHKDYLKDSSVFLRLDINPSWIFKIEAHFMNGTAGLNSSINNGKATRDMDPKWELYLAKTTILF